MPPTLLLMNFEDAATPMSLMVLIPFDEYGSFYFTDFMAAFSDVIFLERFNARLISPDYHATPDLFAAGIDAAA